PGGRWHSLWMVLQLDTPPKEFIVLHYRLGQFVEVSYHWPLGDEGCPYLEWLHDEVDVVPANGQPEIWHSILFSNGLALRLRFLDFDFAPLTPMAPSPEFTKVTQPRPSS